MTTIFMIATTPANLSTPSRDSVEFHEFPLKNINDKTAIDNALSTLARKGLKMTLGQITCDHKVVGHVLTTGHVVLNKDNK